MSPAPTPEALKARARATLQLALSCPHRTELPKGKGDCPGCPPEAICSLGRGRRKGLVNLTECCHCIVEQEQSKRSR